VVVLPDQVVAAIHEERAGARFRAGHEGRETTIPEVVNREPIEQFIGMRAFIAKHSRYQEKIGTSIRPLFTVSTNETLGDARLLPAELDRGCPHATTPDPRSPCALRRAWPQIMQSSGEPSQSWAPDLS